MKNERTSTGFLKISIGPKTRVILNTNRPIDEEAFASIKYYSEVKKIGVEFVRNYGHSNPRNVWLLFQSFIRQSESFLQSANQLNYRASALMYYYGFLNLANGFICLFDPDYVTQRVGHGIKHKFQSGKFSSQFITTESNGVFPKLYELIIGKKLPSGSKLNIQRMLGYCSDISHEYSIAQFGERRLRATILRLLVDSNTKTSWPVIAVSNYSSQSRYKPSKSFLKIFEQVNFSREKAKINFDIFAETFSNYDFYEAKNTSPWRGESIEIPTILQSLRKHLQGHYEPNPYDDNHVLW